MAIAEAFDQSWLAVADNVSIARRAVTAHLRRAGTLEPPLNDIALAASEAMTNVVHHAYRDCGAGSMRVRVEVRRAGVELMVQDDGSGMVPRPDSPGLGLGMPLIATVSDRFDVHARTNGGTQLRIWFKSDPGAATLPA
ncbi:MAG TPA: ATP-binding protein [Solirubrobacteraceae bacterium]